MFSHAEIEKLKSDLSGQATALAEYRQATVATQVNLSSDMAVALGTPTRRLTPFLATVVDAIAGKLEVNDDELKLAKAGDTKTIKRWLGDDRWSLVERELYSAVVRDGKAFILTTWGADGPTFTVREAYNGVCGAHVVNEHSFPAYAFNTWQVGDAAYFDAYYPDRIEKYVKLGDKKEWTERRDTPDEEWPIAWVAEDGTPLGIAITEFSIDNSDIADALQLGRDLNEALLDLLATSRTQGWPQKYLVGQKNAGALLNDLGQPVVSGLTGQPIRRAVQTAPGSIMLLNEGSELGQLEPAKADPGVLDKLLEFLSFVTTVPSHYFDGQWPSGIALVQAESRLNHKVEDHQGRLTSAVVAILRLAIRLSNHFAGTTYDPNQPITIPWHAPQIETEDLKREREQFQQEGLTNLVNAGLMSKEIAVRTLHPDWTEQQILDELVRLNIVQQSISE